MPESAIKQYEQIVVFRLGDQEFGLGIDDVREILALAEITPMPNVPESVAGMINVRGKIIPVVDMHKYLHLPSMPPGPTTRIVVTDLSGVPIGLQVDAATDVIRIDTGSFEPAADIMGVGGLRNVKGVFKRDGRLIALLDISDLASIEALSETGGE